VVTNVRVSNDTSGKDREAQERLYSYWDDHKVESCRSGAPTIARNATDFRTKNKKNKRT
jgi:hypothetical protein